MIWHVIMVRPRHEFDAVADLGRKGITAWTPREVVWSQKYVKTKTGKARKRVSHEMPEAPRYVFFTFGAGDKQWGRVSGSRYFSAWVFAGPEMPAYAPDAVIREYMARNDRKALRRLPKAVVNQRKSFKPGDMVRISDGPWEGRSVQLDAIHGRSGRVVLELFGGEREVSVDLMHLEAA